MWVLTATVLGSALTFIDATVVNIALPTIGGELDAGTSALTWVVNAYALTLAALVLLGGSVGDRFGRRRVFEVGIVVFAGASALCGLAPNVETLIAARAAQGVGGALLTPASLAILQASFARGDRGRAIGAWSGLTGVAAAIGPFLGGWIVEVASWRWVFLVNLPVALVVLLVARRHVPETRDPAARSRPLDVTGSALLVAGLGSVTFGLTALPSEDAAAPWAGGALVAGLLLLVVLALWERRAPSPLLPASAFASRLFVAVNGVTFVVYAALGAIFFSLVVALQVGAGFDPLAAGLSLLPVTVLMLLFSARSGALMERTGPRLPMTLGLLVAASGVGLMSRIDADSDYVLDVLLPSAVFGAGLTLLVTPLTATVLAALPDEQAGVASGVNNAVARTAGLLAVAAVPLVGGLGGDGLTDPVVVRDAFETIALTCAGVLVVGAALSALVLRVPARTTEHEPDVAHHHCALTSPPAAAS